MLVECGFLTVSLRLPPVALLRGVLLLAEGLLAGALLILGLLLTVLRVPCRETHASAANHASGPPLYCRRAGTDLTSRSGSANVILSKAKTPSGYLLRSSAVMSLQRPCRSLDRHTAAADTSTPRDLSRTRFKTCKTFLCKGTTHLHIKRKMSFERRHKHA